MVKKTRPSLRNFPNASAGEPLLEIKELTCLGSRRPFFGVRAKYSQEFSNKVTFLEFNF